MAKIESMVKEEAPFYAGQNNYWSHLCPERIFKMLGLNIVDSYQSWLYKQTHFFKSPRLAEC